MLYIRGYYNRCIIYRRGCTSCSSDTITGLERKGRAQRTRYYIYILYTLPSNDDDDENDYDDDDYDDHDDADESRAESKTHKTAGDCCYLNKYGRGEVIRAHKGGEKVVVLPVQVHTPRKGVVDTSERKIICLYPFSRLCTDSATRLYFSIQHTAPYTHTHTHSLTLSLSLSVRRTKFQLPSDQMYRTPSVRTKYFSLSPMQITIRRRRPGYCKYTHFISFSPGFCR